LVMFWKRKLLARLGDPELISRLMSSRDGTKRLLKNFLILMSAAATVIALAQPQALSGKLNVVREGTDLVLIVDISLSMLADDVKPNRLDYTKKELDRLIQTAKADR